MKSLLQRLTRIDYLISHKKTGNPETLATKVGLSERSVYDYLRLMKIMGAPIRYSRAFNSYCYTEEGHFHVAFIINVDTQEEQTPSFPEKQTSDSKMSLSTY